MVSQFAYGMIHVEAFSLRIEKAFLCKVSNWSVNLACQKTLHTPKIFYLKNLDKPFSTPRLNVSLGSSNLMVPQKTREQGCSMFQAVKQLSKENNSTLGNRIGATFVFSSPPLVASDILVLEQGYLTGSVLAGDIPRRALIID